MYSNQDYNQYANRREAMAAARSSQEPQAIAVALSAPNPQLINPLLLISLLASLIVLISLVLILLGL